MAPRRRGESRFRRLVGPFALFALSANVAYQVSRGLWRAVPRPGVARADGLHDPPGRDVVRREDRHRHHALSARHEDDGLEVGRSDSPGGGGALGLDADFVRASGLSGSSVHHTAAEDRAAELESLFHDDHSQRGVTLPDPPPAPETRAEPGHPRGTGIHVLCTSNGSPYLNWQTRIMYRTFQKAAVGSDMLHFTRLLHRRSEDELMAEVPTVRVDSLHASCDTWCEFPVADRPDALRKWLATEDSRRGEWIAMIETDYVWKKALRMPPPGSSAVAFHFHYINPNYPTLPDVMRKLMPADRRGDLTMEQIPCSGPAPTMIRRGELTKLADEYVRIAAEIEADPDAKKKLGWVREMYAYDLAAALAGVPHDVEDPGETMMIAQPPADVTMGKASMFHYTWGAEYHEAGKKIWSWDKRPYVRTEQVRRPRAHKPELPPPDAGERGGVKLQDGKPVTRETNAILTDMLTIMRDAIDDLDDLPHDPGCGWEQNEPACDFGCEPGKLCEPTKTWRAEAARKNEA